MRRRRIRADRDAPGRRRAGFSLVEVAVATAILGIGMVALLTCVGSGTRTNDAGRKATLGTFLAQEIREWTLRLPFTDPDPGDANNPPGPDGSDPQVFVDDLDDLMDVTYSPPRDGTGAAIANMTEWSQTITLTWRDPANLTSTVSAATSDVIHVGVAVRCGGEPVLTAGWLVVNRED
jgi:prepilin-type N-terminal cleavage/methylation domain-containing protein